MTYASTYQTNLFLSLCYFSFVSYSIRRQGPTLEDLGSILIRLGAKYAINMDGGGSSTMVYEMQSTTVNHPTCLDIPFVECQRKVASVHCISSN